MSLVKNQVVYRKCHPVQDAAVGEQVAVQTLGMRAQDYVLLRARTTDHCDQADTATQTHLPPAT
jgi:hypothetical protein